jgi:ATP-dependent DNA helicase PIF1
MGGLQVIFCGDFFQLPPVVKSSSFMLNETKKSENIVETQQNTQSELISSTQNINLNKDDRNNKNIKRFCFQSDVWKALIKKSFVLDKVFRQQHKKFVKLLDSVRKGNYNSDVENEFRECVGRRLDCNDGILPTHIYTHRNDVDQLNCKELDSLHGTVQEYKSIDSGEPSFIKMLQANCPAKQILKLKIGAQVVLVKTTDIQQGLVNGARGVIVAYTNDNYRPIIRFSAGIEKIINCEKFTISMGGKIVAQRIQIPLDLSWGISVHKSQGMTVERAVINLRKCFEYGQAYVALSRVRSFEGLSLSFPLQEKVVKAHPSVKEFYSSLNIQ